MGEILHWKNYYFDNVDQLPALRVATGFSCLLSDGIVFLPSFVITFTPSVWRIGSYSVTPFQLYASVHEILCRSCVWVLLDLTMVSYSVCKPLVLRLLNIFNYSVNKSLGG